jgi:hypothetical protein
MVPSPMNIRVIPTEEYTRMIREGVWFAQANYGDGEWGCLLGHEGQNVNGERYNRALAAALRDTLLGPTGHWCGTNPGELMRREVEAWANLHRPAVEWVKKDVLPDANRRGQLAPFLAALRTRRVVVVGPAHLTTLSPLVLGEIRLLQVPDGKAWMQASRTAARVQAAAVPGSVVLFASGMASNLTIHQLTPWAREATISLLDVGAVLDPYVGRNTRKAYRRPEFQAALAQNLAAETAPC